MRRVRDVMDTPVVVAATASVQEASARMLDGSTHAAVVVDGGRVVGLVTAEGVARALADGHVASETQAIAIALRDRPILTPDEALADAHQAMRRDGHPVLAVVGPAGEPIGVLADPESAPA